MLNCLRLLVGGSRVAEPIFSMKRFIQHIPLLFLLVIVACKTSLPTKNSESYASAVRSFYIGLAAVQVGDDQRAAAELKKATELAPDEPAVWNNLGVLQLRQKDYDAAFQSLEKARQLAPDRAAIISNLATVENQRGNFDKAVTDLKRTIELEPQNLKAIFALAQQYERQTDDGEALKLYERIGTAKPGNIAVKLETARLAAKLGDADLLNTTVAAIDAASGAFPPEAKEQLGALKTAASSNPRQAATQVSFLRNVLLREPSFRGAIAEIKSDENVVGELLTKPLKLETPDFSPAAPDLEITFAPAASGQTPSNFARSVFLDGEKPVTLSSDDKKTRIGDAEIDFGAKSPFEIAVLDFDYDFRNDIAMATAKGFRLFKQTDAGKFTDATAATKLGSEIVNRAYAGAWTFDADNDGDLDLLLGAVSGPPTALQNNSDGSFTPLKLFAEVSGVRQFVSADLDEDGDGDVVMLDAGKLVSFYSNLRGGAFEKREFAKSATEITAIAVGDANGDGKLDLVAAKTDGWVTILTDKDNGKDWEAAEPFNAGVSASLLIVADVDNNGANDILLSGAAETLIFLGDKTRKFASSANPVKGAVSSVADLDGDGKLDLAGIDENRNPVVFKNQSKKNYHWQIVRPRAAKTEGDQRVNTFGIGGEIEIRSGVFAQKQRIESPQVHFGLGENASADVMRVVWGNGYVQAEFDLKSDQALAAEQRLKGSCPHLFAWNGKEFALVKDAPPWSPALGLKINAQDTYGILQTEEWFKIPGEALQPKDGSYELRITGEYWESFYLDNYQLLAVDHPEDTEIFTDERFAIPLPPLKVFTTERAKPFASATNDRGEDVSATVAAIDEKYLDGFKRGKFQGVAEDHFVEFELPEDAPRDRKIWIVGDGWMHPTDASINVQRGQVPDVKPPKSLSLEIQDANGYWRAAKENLGFPAGKMKTVLIDVPPGAGRFRLRTELEIFWDKLAWAVDLPENQTKETRLDASNAELRYRGFSVIEKRDDSSPEKPVYDKILTTGQRWRDLEGYYTRFGDVSALLAKTDDRMVLMNAGDELVLKFPALPDAPAGWKRDFVLIGNGWIKDGDLNSVFSKTLLPLPTQATNDYSRPPTRLEDDPVYRKNKQDWIDFHTRYVAPDAFRNAVRK